MLLAAIGAWFARGQILLTRDQQDEVIRQQKLALGNLYIERYWQIDDALLLAAKDSAEHTRHRHRYLRLCEDEFQAAAGRWLDLEQWEVWHSWLVDARARVRLVADLGVCARSDQDFESLRACLSASPGHSSADCPALTHPGVGEDAPPVE